MTKYIVVQMGKTSFLLAQRRLGRARGYLPLGTIRSEETAEKICDALEAYPAADVLSVPAPTKKAKRK